MLQSSLIELRNGKPEKLERLPCMENQSNELKFYPKFEFVLFFGGQIDVLTSPYHNV